MKVEALKSIFNIDELNFQKLLKVIEATDKRIFEGFVPPSNKYMSSSLFSYFPFLFKELIDINDDSMLDLIRFSHSYAHTIFILDDVYDNPKSDKKKLLCLMLLNFYSAIFLKEFFYNINYSMEEKTLNQIEKIQKNYFTNLQFEEKLEYQETSIKEELMDQLCINKYEGAKVIFELIKPYFKKEKHYNSILKSFDFYAVGRQVLDDLVDFDEDIQHNKFNYYCQKYYEKTQTLDGISKENIIVDELIKKSTTSYRNAMDELDGIECGWTRFVAVNYNKIICNIKT